MLVFYVFGLGCHGWDILFGEEESGLFLNSRSPVEELRALAPLSLLKDDAGGSVAFLYFQLYFTLFPYSNSFTTSTRKRKKKILPVGILCLHSFP